MKIYSAQHRAIVEAPIMEKPDPQLYLTVKDYEVAMLTYEKRLTSYPPIPVLREHQNLFKDGQEVKEGIDYEVFKADFVSGNYQNKCHFCKNLFRHTDKLWFACQECCKGVAIPIKKQVSEEEPKSNDAELIEFASAISMKAIQEDKEPLPQQEEVGQEFKMPILIKAGDHRILINGAPPAVDCRVVAEDNLQSLQSQLSEALAKIKSQEAEIAVLKEYKDFIENAYNEIYSIAHVHGYRASEELIKKGEDLRKQLK